MWCQRTHKMVAQFVVAMLTTLTGNYRIEWCQWRSADVQGPWTTDSPGPTPLFFFLCLPFSPFSLSVRAPFQLRGPWTLSTHATHSLRQWVVHCVLCVIRCVVMSVTCKCMSHRTRVPTRWWQWEKRLMTALYSWWVLTILIQYVPETIKYSQGLSETRI